jgi:anti-sigma factor RsiW
MPFQAHLQQLTQQQPQMQFEQKTAAATVLPLLVLRLQHATAAAASPLLASQPQLQQPAADEPWPLQNCRRQPRHILLPLLAAPAAQLYRRVQLLLHLLLWDLLPLPSSSCQLDVTT